MKGSRSWNCAFDIVKICTGRASRAPGTANCCLYFEHSPAPHDSFQFVEVSGQGDTTEKPLRRQRTILYDYDNIAV